MSKRYTMFAIWTALAFLTDLGSKLWARAALKPIYPGEIVVIPGWFDFRYSENMGSAFGLFRSIPGARYFLAAVGVVALVLVVGYVRKLADEQKALIASLGMIAGGAVGNILDRVMFGKVTDFVVWKYQTHEWPTFNVADAWLVAGVILLAWKGGKKPPADEKSPAPRK
jgi:signal peptidase II